MKYLPLLTALCCQLFAFPAALAHHSFEAEYDSEKPVFVEGVVSGLEWENPHVWLSVKAAEPDGDVVTWKFWEDSPAILARKGIGPGVLKPGDVVKVYGFQARDGSRKASAGLVTFANGSKVFRERHDELSRRD